MQVSNYNTKPVAFTSNSAMPCYANNKIYANVRYLSKNLSSMLKIYTLTMNM